MEFTANGEQGAQHTRAKQRAGQGTLGRLRKERDALPRASTTGGTVFVASAESDRSGWMYSSPERAVGPVVHVFGVVDQVRRTR